jgi:hypothetical protein
LKSLLAIVLLLGVGPASCSWLLGISEDPVVGIPDPSDAGDADAEDGPVE